MKFILYILTLILLSSCADKKRVEIERDIYITSLDSSLNPDGKLNLKNSLQAIHLSKDFWNYFIRTHAKTSAMIFMLPLYDTNNNYVALPDTSYSFYNITKMESIRFTRLLADSVTGQEKGNQNAGFFVIPNDTTGSAAKQERIAQNLQDYQINPTVTAEFDYFKRILTGQDTSAHYIIVFRKSFADKIDQLFK